MQTQTLDITALPAAMRGGPAAGHGIGRDAVRVDVLGAMAPIEAAWRSLEQDNLASIHQSYDWCAAWSEATNHPLAIVSGSVGDDIVFILPLEIVRAGGIRRAQFIGAHHSNINTGLFSSDFKQTAKDGLMLELQGEVTRSLRGKADLLVLGNVPLDWRGQRSPLAGLPGIENQNHAFQLPFLGAFETTLKQVNAKRRRKKFRHQSRILDDKGGYEHMIAATAAERQSLLDLFFQQKAVRFEAARLPDVFRDDATRRALHRLTELSSADGTYAALEMHALRLKGEHEGHMPAVAALSRKGDHIICQFASIDETQVAEASPGELLFWLMIERLHREGIALFDFGIGDQIYKRSWCPAETVQHDLILPISATGHAAALAQRGVTRAKSFIKTNPRIYGFIQRLRARQGVATDAGVGPETD